MATASCVLVVDDEHSLRRLLRLYLENEGYTVLEADNGMDGLSLLRRGGSMALVDVMLPGLDGFELVRRVRVESSVPIILLTARGEETHRVAGLETGADDYVVKPFSAPEVVARVRVQLRRTSGGMGRPGPCVMGPGAGSAGPAGERRRPRCGVDSSRVRPAGGAAARSRPGTYP